MSPRAVNVLVLGAGAAGAQAAARLASLGHDVTCVHKGGSATRMSSGAFDVADPAKDDVPGVVSEPFEASSVRKGLLDVQRTHLRHPYARVPGTFPEFAAAADAFFALTAGLEWVRAEAPQDPPTENVVALTQLGTAKRTYAVQDGMFAFTGQKSLTVVDCLDLGAFDATPCARMLRHMATLTHREVAIDVLTVPRILEGAPPHDVTHWARRLARAEGAEARFVGALKAALNARAGPAPDTLLFPPMFTGQAGTISPERISAAVGVPCATLLALPPAAPGERLQKALLEGMTQAGVTVLDGKVEGGTIENGRVRRVDVVRGGERQVLNPDCVVLATGRFLSGGLDRTRVATETVFGLPVRADGREVGDRFIGELTGQLPDDEHAIFRAGVGYDARLRPTAASGAMAAANLFAAGSVLEGYDPARDGSGLGVCAWTGYRAADFVHAYLLGA